MQNRTAARLAARLVATCVAAAAPFWAQAQVTQKPDGQWRSLFTAGASMSGGNTNAKSYSLGADVIRLTASDKWAFNGAGQYSTSEGERTADRINGTLLRTHDITPVWFGFGELDLLHDAESDIKSRATLGAGVGYHVIRKPDDTFDVSGGLAYTLDRYSHAQVIDDELRSKYNHTELLLSEESNHKISDSTTFKQKLTVYPNLNDTDHVRTIFDAGLSVAMTPRLALTATFEHRYDSKPGEGVGKTDTVLVTGVSLRFD